MTSIDQFVGLHAQMNELMKRVGNGSLDVERVKRGLQGIMDPRTKIMGWVPSWWRTPEDQIKRARKLWPGIELPSPPESFAPKEPTSVLLLHVPLPLGDLWNAVRLTHRFAHTSNTFCSGDLSEFRPLGGKPMWIEYDSKLLLDHPVGGIRKWTLVLEDGYLASCEALLSACIQFDGYLSQICRHDASVLAWAKGAEDYELFVLNSTQQGRCTNYDEGCCIEGDDCAIEHWDEYRLLRRLDGDDLPQNRRWVAPALNMPAQ